MTHYFPDKLSGVKQLTCLMAFLFLPGVVKADRVLEQRETFHKAQTYINEHNDAGFLALSSGLADYPLYPYLRYQWLKGKLAQTNDIVNFLATYKATRYAPLLRAKWLDYLAAHQRWGEFFVNHEADNNKDDCRFYWAQHQTGQHIQALSEAKRLWIAGKEAKGYCLDLFGALQKSALLTSEQNWRRFESALSRKHKDTAKSVLPLMAGKDRIDAELWLTLHQKPETIDEERYWLEKTERTGRLFAHAIKQLITLDVNKALLIWEAKKANFTIDKTTFEEVERRFGMALLGEKDPRAYVHLAKVTAAPEQETRFAKVRAALVEQNWQHAADAIEGLTVDEKRQPQWQYWQARALAQTGRVKQAEDIYKTLAKDRSFYGFLAADASDMPYQFSDNPVKVDEAALKNLANEPDFKACQEFTFVNLPVEARRQWHFAIKNLPKAKLIVAAKLAQQWQWHQIAITTLVKADYWDDLSIRFPLHYPEFVHANANKTQLDSALIYGVMRQESMLDKEAVSSVGALGLMQLMPETAKTVALSLQDPWLSSDELFKPEVNIRYGSHYFKSLLDKFSGNAGVAGAAYNAGPHRALKWLPALSSVPADVWIDTIPYKETRKYVTSVLSYAIIYQNRLQKQNFKLKDLLPEVRPATNLS